MEAAKVLEIKPKKQPKIKIEVVQPKDVYAVWTLMKKSLMDQTYPDNTEENEDNIIMRLFQVLSSVAVGGFVAKVGNKPVGTLIAEYRDRAYGRPKKFAFIWMLYVDPSVRKKGVGNMLWKSFSDKLKSEGIHHWEANCHEELEKQLVRDSGVPVKRLYVTVGGRL